MACFLLASFCGTAAALQANVLRGHHPATATAATATRQLRTRQFRLSAAAAAAEEAAPGSAAELHELLLSRGALSLHAAADTAGAAPRVWERVELRTLTGGKSKTAVGCTYVDATARVYRRYSGGEVQPKLAQLLGAQRWSVGPAAAEDGAPEPPQAGEAEAEAEAEAGAGGRSWLLGAPPAPPGAPPPPALPFLTALCVYGASGAPKAQQARKLTQIQGDPDPNPGPNPSPNPNQARKLTQIQAFLRGVFDVGPNGI